MKEMILKTKRLLLRELKQDDFDDICKLLQDPIVMYAYEGAFSKKEVQEWLDKQLRRYQNDGFGLWGMIEKGSGELIGQCGLTYQEFNGQQVPEIGYLLRAEYWHKGYATEAAIACKEYAFNILNFDKVYSIIRDTNIPSQKVALRNDMREIANFIKHYRNIDMLHLVFCVDKSSYQAERLGFEPRERLPAHRISSAARSTTPASFLVVDVYKST